MTQKDPLGIVPAQYTGKEIEADISVELDDEHQACLLFTAAKKRLQNVNQWHKTAGFVSATFQVFDSKANEVNRNVEQGDFLRIDIPGPGSKDGGGYDWVTVEELKELETAPLQSFGFRVRPVANPKNQTNQVAHFYSDESTSTFVVSREGRKVTAFIIDSNTKANNEADSITDQIRNTSVAMNAIVMFSKAQWQNLVDGLLSSK